MADKLETIQILFVKRNARKRGRTSSDDYNDMIDELAHDLAEFNTQWNNRLVPLTTTIPDGTVDSDIDAYTNGLSGRHLYADADSTSTSNPTYYNASSGRPYSILEQFAEVYGEIESVRNDLSADLQASVPTAEQIVIADAGGYYTASTVEDALAEVKNAVDNVTAGNVDLSAVNQHYIPLDDDTWDLGTSSKRIRDLYLGPTSLNIMALESESETPLASGDKTYSFRVNSGTGDLELYETAGGGTVIAQFTTTGTLFPAGGGGTPGGADTNIQFNDGGVLGGSANLTWDGSTLDITGAITVSSTVDGVDISAHASNSDAHHTESHTIASHSDTSATGTELNTLTDGSDADTLHTHATYDTHVAAASPHTGHPDIGGTPANNQVAVWTDTSTVSGDANLTYDGDTLLIAGASDAKRLILKADASQTEPLIQLQNSSGLALNAIHSVGNNNLMLGIDAGYSITTGNDNFLVGNSAAYSITSGYSNIVIGNTAGFDLEDGNNNVLLGNSAGQSLVGGDDNFFVGSTAGQGSTSGDSNCAIGNSAGQSIASGNNNIMIGEFAGQNTAGSNNIFLGYSAGTNSEGSNNICIGQNTDTSIVAADYELNIGDTIKGNLSTKEITLVSGLDIQGDLTVSGTIDGRDIATDGSTLDSHIVDSTIHFTESTIDHVNILNIGTYTHSGIDTHIDNSNNPHSTSIANIDSGTLSELNTAISDATLIDTTDSRLSDARTPLTHALSHEQNNTDPLFLEFMATSGIANKILETDGSGGWTLIDTPTSSVSTLTDLDDVSGSPTDGQVLTYVTTSGEWLPQDATGGGSAVRDITTVKTTNYTAVSNEVVRCDPSGGGFTVTLPTAVGIAGEEIVVKNTTNSTNTITVDTTSSQTIDGSLTIDLIESYKSLTFVSYGDNWGII